MTIRKTGVNGADCCSEVHVDEMEEEEEHEETNENGDVISEWTITTTTRITQIYWERGNDRKKHIRIPGCVMEADS